MKRTEKEGWIECTWCVEIFSYKQTEEQGLAPPMTHPDLNRRLIGKSVQPAYPAARW